MIALALLLSCAPHAPPKPPLEAVTQLALTRSGHSLAGLAAISVTPDLAQLQVISAGGVELFSVQATPEDVTAQAPDPELAGLIERVPFYRDLSLVFTWRCPEARCQVGGGRLRVERDAGRTLLHWRGPGGPATVALERGRATLSDPRRGYVLTVLGEPIDVD
ncbi:MAG: hypothetical protein H6739_33415 [Alphaproteobacteria bacterium]|nr:hypothetical protein [Alphaproteobacteria bacterium]